MQRLNRNVRVPRQPVNRWSVVLAAGGLSGIAIGIAALTIRPTVTPPAPAPAPAPVVAPAPAPVPPPPPDPDPDDAPDVSSIVRGSCDLSIVPPALVESVSDAETDELVDELRHWIRFESWNGGPRIEYRRGVL